MIVRNQTPTNDHSAISIGEMAFFLPVNGVVTFTSEVRRDLYQTIGIGFLPLVEMTIF
jgi:hypothetical protein